MAFGPIYVKLINKYMCLYCPSIPDNPSVMPTFMFEAKFDNVGYGKRP